MPALPSLPRTNPTVALMLLTGGAILVYAGYHNYSVGSVLGLSYGGQPQPGGGPTNPANASFDIGAATSTPSTGSGIDPAVVTSKSAGPGSLLYSLATIAHHNFGLHIRQYGPGLGAKYPISETAVTPVHAPGSYHYKGMAFDASGSESDMHQFAKYVEDHYRPHILELIHNPGFAIKNGRDYAPGPGPFGAVWAGHTNHVHVAA